MPDTHASTETGAPPLTGPARPLTAVEQEADRRKALARAAMLGGPVLPTLLRLVLPTVTVLVAQTGVNIAEAYYVGLLGTDALAGVALVFPVFMLMMMSGGGLGSGVASAVARAIGAGRQHDADALVLHAVVLAVVVGALFTLGTVAFGPALYGALGGESGALDAALLYSNWLFAGAIPVWVVNLLAAALRGSGNVRLPALVTLSGAVILIPFSPLLIFGFGPVPGLGIAGAGIAFALYYLGAAAVLLWTMTSGRAGLMLRLSRLRAGLFRDILKVGLPTAFSTVMTNLTVILVTGAFGHFGTDALAGYGAASRLAYVLVPLLFGLASAVLTMVGINLAAGQGLRARHAAGAGGLVGFGVTQLIGLVVALHPELWLRLFTEDPAVLATGATYLQHIGPAYGVFGFGFVLSFAGQGAGRVFWPVTGVAARLVIGAGLGALFVGSWGAGMPALSWILAASLLAYAVISSIVLVQRDTWRSSNA
ncbi:MATE family efflux transporter [Muricoccus aerilatus]|uniref:MATE family efflux transporter n=1 Tax=Muricoccus aerilatus TaxID=452982 RepID=UPI000693DA48|nr:MATE family efflux transporter [Roseomonas aerilata]